MDPGGLERLPGAQRVLLAALVESALGFPAKAYLLVQGGARFLSREGSPQTLPASPASLALGLLGGGRDEGCFRTRGNARRMGRRPG